MFRRLLGRTDNAPQAPVPPDALPADVLAWSEVVDVSRLSDKVIRDFEYYLKNYKYMPLGDRQELGWRLISLVQSHVSPPPPLDAQPMDVLAIVLAARRRQLGIG